MLSLLTLNVQAAALPRAKALLCWLDTRDDDVIILTETSAGEGSRYLLDQCRRAGLHVIWTPGYGGDRGTALVSRVPLVARPDLVDGVSLPGRVAAAMVPADPTLFVIGVYVPSSDRAPDKVARKQAFISSLLDALRRTGDQVRGRLILAGDYNVISRTHQPRYRAFLPFEYEMLDALRDEGLVDAFEHCSPGVQAHSWIGRSGNGYRFDYIHVGAALAGQISSCSYLHETREKGLSDHAAVHLTLAVPTAARLDLDPAGVDSVGALF